MIGEGEIINEGLTPLKLPVFGENGLWIFTIVGVLGCILTG
jgi:hypothetical protein